MDESSLFDSSDKLLLNVVIPSVGEDGGNGDDNNSNNSIVFVNDDKHSFIDVSNIKVEKGTDIEMPEHQKSRLEQ